MNIPYEAISEASMVIDDEAYKIIGWEGVTRILEAAAPHITAPVVELCDKADNQYGSSMYCKLTTYEVREVLGAPHRE